MGHGNDVGDDEHTQSARLLYCGRKSSTVTTAGFTSLIILSDSTFSSHSFFLLCARFLTLSLMWFSSSLFACTLTLGDLRFLLVGVDGDGDERDVLWDADDGVFGDTGGGVCGVLLDLGGVEFDSDGVDDVDLFGDDVFLAVFLSVCITRCK